MQPNLVTPIHDPGGVMLPYLWKIEPDLKARFAHAFVGITADTQALQEQALARLAGDSFYRIEYFPPGSLPGEHYRAIYQRAVAESDPAQPLLLCDLDRVAFALLTEYRSSYLTDLDWAFAQEDAVLFQRSKAAWKTYPDNYRQIEGLIIQAGELLFERTYDFAWSHFCLRAGSLARLLPQITSLDFGVVIEIVLLLHPHLHTLDVDWLAWEDPFILECDPEELRHSRSASREETLKRLRGMLPFFQHFLEKAPELNRDLKWEKSGCS